MDAVFYLPDDGCTCSYTPCDCCSGYILLAEDPGCSVHGAAKFAITPEQWAARVEAARSRWESTVEEIDLGAWREAMIRLYDDAAKTQSPSRQTVLAWRLRLWLDRCVLRPIALCRTACGRRK